MTAAGITWDLSALYAGPDDPTLRADMAEALRAATAFRARYHGRVATLAPAELAQAIAEYEAIEELGRRPSFYASLLFAADTENDLIGALREHAREGAVRVDDELTAFELELTALDDARYATLAADPVLADCRHWLDGLRRQRPHMLSEAEERLVQRKNLAGRDAFVRLYDEVSSALRFRLVVDGAERELTGEETLALLDHPDAALRERAQTTFLEGFATERRTFAAVLNAVFYDHRLECELRRFPDVVAPTHLDNQVRSETVEAMLAATERRYPVAQEYFRLKARLLGLPRLKSCDLHAPLATAPATLPFADAQALVLEAFAGFSPTFAELGRDFFARRWIDAEPRPGKRLGAFCASLGPSGNPYVLMTYTDMPRDAATLAHELGHGIHDRLASRQRPINYDPPLTLAETASTFAEMLLLRALLARETAPAARRNLLAAKLDDLLATISRQAVLTRFEMAAHARRRDTPLDADDLGDLWWAENARLYGDAVEMLPAYRWGWSYIPHFVHSRFYCYSYVFGELLVLALFQRYLDEGESFIPRYVELLAAGDSEAPDVLLRRLGCDVDDPAFWERGFAVVAGLVEELRAAAAA